MKFALASRTLIIPFLLAYLPSLSPISRAHPITGPDDSLSTEIQIQDIANPAPPPCSPSTHNLIGDINLLSDLCVHFDGGFGPNWNLGDPFIRAYLNAHGLPSTNSVQSGKIVTDATPIEVMDNQGEERDLKSDGSVEGPPLKLDVNLTDIGKIGTRTIDIQ